MTSAAWLFRAAWCCWLQLCHLGCMLPLPLGAVLHRQCINLGCHHHVQQRQGLDGMRRQHNLQQHSITMSKGSAAAAVHCNLSMQEQQYSGCCTSVAMHTVRTCAVLPTPLPLPAAPACGPRCCLSTPCMGYGCLLLQPGKSPKRLHGALQPYRASHLHFSVLGEVQIWMVSLSFCYLLDRIEEVNRCDKVLGDKAPAD